MVADFFLFVHFDLFLSANSFPGVLEITLLNSEGGVISSVASPYADIETISDDVQSKLCMGIAMCRENARKVLSINVQSTMACFENLHVIHISAAPHIISFVCSQNANAGAVLDSIDEISSMFVH